MQTDSLYGQVIHLPKRAKATDAFRPTPQLASILTDVHPAIPTDPTATAFTLSLLAQEDGPILWVQDHASRRENGQVYTTGLKTFGVVQPVLLVRVTNPKDVLWAMEEGAACGGLSAVIGEIHGAPAVLSFTATKRLAMRAETSKVPIFLIRSGDPGTLSSARERWRIGSLPSHADQSDGFSPGSPRWDMHLFRARGRPPGRWVAQYDPDAARPADRLSLVSGPDLREMDQSDQSIPDRAGG